MEFNVKPLLSRNIIISGKTDTGKTTLLKNLVSKIPDNAKILVFEDVPELNLQKTYPNKNIITIENKNTESIVKLIESNVLKFKPDYFILGELKGNDMRTLLSWFETDVADGCKLITTTWANTSSIKDRLSNVFDTNNTMSSEKTNELVNDKNNWANIFMNRYKTNDTECHVDEVQLSL